MSLSVALQVAQSALAARQTESSVIARNITGAQEPGFSKKSVQLSTMYTSSGQAGGLRVNGVARMADSALYASLLTSTSVGTSQQAKLDGITRMAETIGDTELETSPAALLGELQKTLQNYASDPNNSVMAQDTLQSAKNMAASLRSSSDLVQEVRANADSDMATSVREINSLLGELENLNSTIVKGTQNGADVTDALDDRDQVLLALSEEIGIKTIDRANGDIVVYTDSGVTLFETSAREVSFAPTTTYSPGTVGSAVIVDGVPVTGPGAIMPISSGRLHGLAELRDDTAVTYQSQLDEIARGVIEAFGESNGDAGLFTWSGAPAIPPGATHSVGLAADIIVNPNADPDQGGSLDRIRDGFSVAYNPAGDAGFSARLQELVGAFDTSRTFAGSVELDPDASLNSFAGSSVSWLENGRKTLTKNVEIQSVIVGRTAENLSNTTGVNIDEELTLLLEVERAYAAASRLITAVDTMLEELMMATR
ncbi:flagellar hook-associated protein FlgK [Roseibium alexandrii]|jgi:flagellar hook-associated protein 1 FlgK|uniref:Flagellar hook-associated protein 1 n=1 Tax=Roseibium alexandrii TaxID=388408 RepID=A0A0M7AKS1_9HYPH|nr:flagellar hook-associated protein FlgK [Roseibium alexandrii]CTQ75006.1 Flagellar hook-associated protein 1 [Roseibium alexandrii]